MGFGEVQKEFKGKTFAISQRWLGLAYDQISVDKLATLIESATSLSKKIFSFYMVSNLEESCMVITPSSLFS